MIEGKTSLALAYAERASRHDATHVRTTAIKEGTGWKLSGEKVFVLNGHAADQIVVSAKLGDGICLFVLDRDTPGLVIVPIKHIDGTRGALLRLEGAVVADDRRLNEPGKGAAILEHAIDYGAAAACAEGLGVVDTMLALTVSYLKERKQFDVPIGSFQALQHRAVDMFVQVQLCRATNVLAAVRADEPDAAIRRADISAAKVQLATGGKLVAQQSIQLYGGVGITDEYDIGLYFKRMQALNALFGDEEHHVSRFMRDASFTAV
jgi:alkylation response protein AidB-like acyl-CoA dehydrogenase